MSIAQSIKQANPQIDPGTLFRATEEQIRLMKGVEPEVKDYMLLQTKMAEMTTQLHEKQMIIDGQNLRNAATNETKREVADTQADARTSAAKTAADSRVTSAGIGAKARVSAAGIGADARKYGADRSLDGAKVRGAAEVDSAKERGGAQRDSARTSADARVKAARVTAGKDPGDSGGGSAPPFPPTAGHKATAPDGSKWKADGKKWVKVGG